MSVLLDTHFLLWILTGARRLERYPWLERYAPWGVSPISLLEIQFLAEAGRLDVQQPEFTKALSRDPRFVIDEVPLVALVEKALPMSWTQDPFDRLLAAHSTARRTPLCTTDRAIQAAHPCVVEELRA